LKQQILRNSSYQNTRVKAKVSLGSSVVAAFCKNYYLKRSEIVGDDYELLLEEY
jgi:hypothetical protein